ncbi:hypothetical protein [Thaumasiovibrio sp. DFM-14]|uniref:hypothetical protein n=1 Tax=Thaumasiovibrio sp. DFM-14 TaxID=3384792 RepID=UPI0039A36745
MTGITTVGQGKLAQSTGVVFICPLDIASFTPQNSQAEEWRLQEGVAKYTQSELFNHRGSQSSMAEQKVIKFFVTN